MVECPLKNKPFPFGDNDEDPNAPNSLIELDVYSNSNDDEESENIEDKYKKIKEYLNLKNY